MKAYHENLIDEVIELIKDNLVLLYNYNDEALINIRMHCCENYHHKYKPLTYEQLISFTEEALSEIINMPEWYDFRPLE